MVFRYRDYRSFLKDELAARAAKNHRYSLRSFAKNLGMAHTSVSEVLRGKKNLSPTAALKVALKLSLPPDQAEYFCLMAQLETTHDPILKVGVVDRIQILNPQYESIDVEVDRFKSISEWYYAAIFGLSYLKDNDLSVRNIVRRFGITPTLAEEALERLKRLGFLKANDSGVYKTAHSHVVIRSEIKNEALREFHKQMLDKAKESLETQNPNEKIVGSETFGFSPELLPEANRITERYFRSLVKLSKSSPANTEVYHVGVQVFRLTRPLRKILV